MAKIEPLGDYKRELARRLSASYISVQLGISLEYAYKRHTNEGSTGSYWLSLAEQIVSDMSARDWAAP